MPVPGLVHRYRDRALLMSTTTCSMYCRHCTRRRLVGGTEDFVAKSEIDNAIKYIERATEVRDVLISGGDPLVLSDQQLESIIKRVRAIDQSVHAARLQKQGYPAVTGAHFPQGWRQTARAPQRPGQQPAGRLRFGGGFGLSHGQGRT